MEHTGKWKGILSTHSLKYGYHGEDVEITFVASTIDFCRIRVSLSCRDSSNGAVVFSANISDESPVDVAELKQHAEEAMDVIKASSRDVEVVESAIDAAAALVGVIRTIGPVEKGEDLEKFITFEDSVMFVSREDCLRVGYIALVKLREVSETLSFEGDLPGAIAQTFTGMEDISQDIMAATLGRILIGSS